MARQSKSSWSEAAAIVIITLMLASFDSNTINAFSTSSLASSMRTIHTNLPINSRRTVHIHNNNRRSRTTSTSLDALSNPLSMLTKSVTATTTASKAAVVAFTPPITNFALHSLKAISALTATITGGIFAGSLHAIAGPDHLAALIPRCCGLPWFRAARVGAVWGFGHGISATILGVCGYLFKKGVRLSGVFGAGANGGNSFDLLHHAGSFLELAIGMSLIIVGLLGIKEAREWESPSPDHSGIACDVLIESDDGKTMTTTNKSVPQSSRAVLFNGILHGFSWDGAPSLAPAVAISTLRGSLTFLLSYALGTMVAMSFATTIIGEGTRRAAGKLDRPDLPRDLSLVSSFLALVVGIVWCALAL